MKRYLLLGAIAVAALAQTGDRRIERPKFSLDSKLQMVALTGLAAADYHSTQRAFANVPTGREANPLLSCGGQLCGSRYALLNGAVIAGNYAINRWVAPKLSPGGRRALSLAMWGMIGGRGYVVARNYQKGSK